MQSHITIESTFTSKCLTAISVRHRHPQKTPPSLRYSQNPQTHIRGVHTQFRDHIPTSGDYRQLQIPQVSSRDPKPQSENTNAPVVTADASQVTQNQFGGQWSTLTDPTPTLWDPDSVKACPGHITGVLDPYMKTQSHHSIPIPIIGNQNLLGPWKTTGKPDTLRIPTLRSEDLKFHARWLQAQIMALPST